MSEVKHTPGPWQVGPIFDNDGEPEIIIEHMTPHGNLVVAVAIGGLRGQEANARLIAAAPDLLKACIDADWHSLDLPRVVREKLSSAIAKATGDQQ